MTILPLALLACGGTTEAEVCDTAAFVCDTAAYWERQQEQNGTADSTDGLWLQNIQAPGCAGTDMWSFGATTSATGGGAHLVNAWVSPQSGGFNEEHALPSIGPGPDGTDSLQTLLFPGVPEADIVANERTSFACGVHDVEPIMTYAVRIYDADGTLADCGIFSNRADGEAAINTLFVGTVVQPTAVTRPEELTAENCPIWRIPTGGSEPTNTTGSTGIGT
jgi:hypothetical protein